MCDYRSPPWSPNGESCSRGRDPCPWITIPAAAPVPQPCQVRREHIPRSIGERPPFPASKILRSPPMNSEPLARTSSCCTASYWAEKLSILAKHSKFPNFSKILQKPYLYFRTQKLRSLRVGPALSVIDAPDPIPIPKTIHFVVVS